MNIKRFLSLLSLVIITPSALLAIDPTGGAIPIVGGLLGGKGLSKLKHEAMDTLNNAGVTMTIAQIFFLLGIITILIGGTICLLAWIRERHFKKFRKLLHRLDMEATAQASSEQTLAQINEFVDGKVFNKLVEPEDRKLIKDILGRIKPDSSLEDRHFMIHSIIKSL